MEYQLTPLYITPSRMEKKCKTLKKGVLIAGVIYNCLELYYLLVGKEFTNWINSSRGFTPSI